MIEQLWHHGRQESPASINFTWGALIFYGKEAAEPTDMQTNKATNKRTDGHRRRVKPPLLWRDSINQSREEIRYLSKRKGSMNENQQRIPQVSGCPRLDARVIRLTTSSGLSYFLSFCLYFFVFADRYLGDVRLIGMKVCTSVDLSSEQSFVSFSGGIFRGYQMRGQERGSGGPVWPLRHFAI